MRISDWSSDVCSSDLAYAGMEPKAPIYGGWESDTIAGHTLGHYMTALVLTWQQTGDPEMRRRADYIVDELAATQAARGPGYIGCLGRQRNEGRAGDGGEIIQENHTALISPAVLHRYGGREGRKG